MTSEKILTAKALLRDRIGYPFISDVIKALNISRNTFYRCFPSDEIEEIRKGSL